MTKKKKILVEQSLREVQCGVDIKRDGQMRSRCTRLRLITNTSFQVATISRDIIIPSVSAIQHYCYFISLWLYLFTICVFTSNFYYWNKTKWVNFYNLAFQVKKKIFSKNLSKIIFEESRIMGEKNHFLWWLDW